MNPLRPRVVQLALAASAALLALTACTAGTPQSGAPTSIDPSASHDPVTLTIWSAWTGREFKEFNEIFKGFEQKYPWITVDSKGGIADDKITAGIASGKPPDVVLSFGVDNIGEFCNTGAWQDLNPWIKGPDGIDMTKTFPPATVTYTSYAGSQCALPFMTDTYGLYMNSDLLSQAGVGKPPKTLDELQADAKKLTVFNSDGSIKVAGFVPWFGYYCCGASTVNAGNIFDAKWYDDSFQSAFASDPNWAKLFDWQQQFIADVYGNGDFATGSKKLKTFVSGAADEWGCSQDFMKGRVAMAIDGEWRNAFIKDCAPDLTYDTAPWPVPADMTDRYGSGTAGGTTIGIPRGSPSPDEAWLLVKYMSTDTDTLVYMANTINNVPTTYAALKSPDLDLPPQFQTFLDVFVNPLSGYRPTTPIGDKDQTVIGNVADKWQNGNEPDLSTGLQDAAQQVDTALNQATGGP